MTLASIALLNLRRRKAKAAFVLAGLVIGVSTVVGLISLIETMTQDINHKLEKYGANILIVPRTENLSLSYEGLSLGGVSFETKEIPEADLAGIKGIKNAANVAAVGPMVLGVVEVAGQRVLLAGLDFSSARVLKPWWRIGGGQAGSGGRLKGQGSAPGPDGLLLGAEAAGILGLKPGDKVEIRGRSLTVSGVLEPTGSQDDSSSSAAWPWPSRSWASLAGSPWPRWPPCARPAPSTRWSSRSPRSCPGPRSWPSSRWSRAGWRPWATSASSPTASP